MAKEWYLMTTPYDQVSGYESDAFDDFAQEGFLEALDSDIATTVDLCNYDLSECETIKVIIENRTQDTKLKTLNRMFLSPIGTCRAGMYIKYDNRYWLLVGVTDNNGMFEKSIGALCNYLITWVDDKGKIHQRWANVQNASQYNNGEQEFRHFVIRADQLAVAMPDDEDTLMLTSGKRFIIDKRCRLYEKRFDSSVLENTDNPVLTYSITRVNNVIYDYQDSGYVDFMFDQDEQHDADGYYVVDGKGYWLCDAVDTTKSVDPSEPKGNAILEETEKPTQVNDEQDVGLVVENLTSEIETESNEIFNGVDPGVFIAKFYDEHGEVVSAPFEWQIESDFTDKLQITYDDNAIYIYVDDDKLLNKSFNLLLIADGYDTASVQVTIRAFI
jgi:hypothetical protein